jgi:prophage regulatory protein
MFNASNTGLEAYVRQSQLLRDRIIPFSAATLWRRVSDGSFPQPVQLSKRVTAWRMSDIQKWQRGEFGGAVS